MAHVDVLPPSALVALNACSSDDGDATGKETVLKVSTQGLTYAKACGSASGGYKEGTIAYEAASGKVDYVFANCVGTLKFGTESL
jgi:hypothetical protein